MGSKTEYNLERPTEQRFVEATTGYVKFLISVCALLAVQMLVAFGYSIRLVGDGGPITLMVSITVLVYAVYCVAMYFRSENTVREIYEDYDKWYLLDVQDYEKAEGRYKVLSQDLNKQQRQEVVDERKRVLEIQDQLTQINVIKVRLRARELLHRSERLIIIVGVLFYGWLLYNTDYDIVISVWRSLQSFWNSL